MMVHFYAAIIKSILLLTIWYAAATAKDKGRGLVNSKLAILYDW